MSEFPTFDESIIDKKLEERMQLAQKISSMVLSLRKKSFMRVRQPLSKIMIPILDQEYKHQIQQVESLILHEVNVKEVQYISESDGILVRNIKPNFKTLGPRFGKLMKQIAAAITEMNQEQISTLERDGNIVVMIDGAPQTIELGDVDIFAQDIPGWAVANEGLVTIALDLTLTDELYAEGLARDFVNRIQNIRKEQNFDVTDTIQIFVEQKELVADALLKNISYICSETLADKLEVIKEIEKSVALEIELTDEIVLTISVLRNN
jgi:isoleucyl-tRNA synthetase